MKIKQADVVQQCQVVEFNVGSSIKQFILVIASARNDNIIDSYT